MMGGVARVSARATHRDVLVVASYLPGETPFVSQRFDVVPVLCVGDFDYSRGLASAWATGKTVVNVEHDLEVSDDLIAALVDCPEPLCSWAYLVYPVSGIHDGPAYPFTAGNPGPWIREGEQWADWAAPGFIKVRPDARTGPLPEKHWLGVEAATNFHTPGRWHIHWPAVEHHHR